MTDIAIIKEKLNENVGKCYFNKHVLVIQGVLINLNIYPDKNIILNNSEDINVYIYFGDIEYYLEFNINPSSIEIDENNIDLLEEFICNLIKLLLDNKIEKELLENYLDNYNYDTDDDLCENLLSWELFDNNFYTILMKSTYCYEYHIKLYIENYYIYITKHEDRKSTRLNSSHVSEFRMPSSA